MSLENSLLSGKKPLCPSHVARTCFWQRSRTAVSSTRKPGRVRAHQRWQKFQANASHFLTLYFFDVLYVFALQNVHRVYCESWAYDFSMEHQKRESCVLYDGQFTVSVMEIVVISANINRWPRPFTRAIGRYRCQDHPARQQGYRRTQRAAEH